MQEQILQQQMQIRDLIQLHYFLSNIISFHSEELEEE